MHSSRTPVMTSSSARYILNPYSFGDIIVLGVDSLRTDLPSGQEFSVAANITKRDIHLDDNCMLKSPGSISGISSSSSHLSLLSLGYSEDDIATYQLHDMTDVETPCNTPPMRPSPSKKCNLGTPQLCPSDAPQAVPQRSPVSNEVNYIAPNTTGLAPWAATDIQCTFLMNYSATYGFLGAIPVGMTQHQIPLWKNSLTGLNQYTPNPNGCCTSPTVVSANESSNTAAVTTNNTKCSTGIRNIIWASSDAPPPCPHPNSWKRLRAKRGFGHFTCCECGIRFKIPRFRWHC